MVDHSVAVAVNLDRFDGGLTDEFACIVLNLEIRVSSEIEAARRLSRALDIVGESPVALRIDSALRGHVRMLVEGMLRRGDVMVTDTSPSMGDVPGLVGRPSAINRKTSSRRSNPCGGRGKTGASPWPTPRPMRTSTGSPVPV